ncbi:MAG: MBL fold metallo-hydrolase [Acidimicrobiia bacterium]
MELTVLGCSGSYGAPAAGACSGYLVRDGATTIWMDCGNGSFVNLQRHVDPAELTAVVITHEHPDHCVDIYGLHVLLRYGLERAGVPLYAPAGAEQRLGALVQWGDTFDWRAIDDGATATVDGISLAFSRTDHPPPTYAVELTDAGARRLVYTSDTGPEWSVDAFAPGADLVLSEASYVHSDRRSPIHLSGRQAGNAAREARAERLVLTHLWPQVDPAMVIEEGSDAFGAPVALAAVDFTVTI